MQAHFFTVRRKRPNLHLLLGNGDVYLPKRLIGCKPVKVEPLAQKRPTQRTHSVGRLPIWSMIPRNGLIAFLEGEAN